MIIPLHLVPPGALEGTLDDAAATVPDFAGLGDDIALLSLTIGGRHIDPALRPQAAPLDLASPLAGPVDGAELQRFAQLMAAENIALQSTRMLYDPQYAFERLAQGHASGNDALRELSQRMFQRYEQAGQWIGLIH